MLVPNVSEEPDFALRHKHGHAERVDGRVSEALVVEAAAAVEPLEVFLVGLATEEAEISDFEVGEELAVVVVPSVEGVEEPIQVGFRVYQLRVRVDEGHGPRPERWE